MVCLQLIKFANTIPKNKTKNVEEICEIEQTAKEIKKEMINLRGKVCLKKELLSHREKDRVGIFWYVPEKLI